MKKKLTNADFIAMEHEVLKFWDDNKCFEKLVEKNKNGKRYRFIDGPMTANNAMGIHHAWGRTLKDTFLKYNAMCGKSSDYRNGFDCQGLWVEVEVEKQLGFKNKNDIQAFGLDNFTNACMDRVKKYSAIITEQSKRLGQWMDWDNSYYTNSDENITSIWYFLKKCNEMGLIESRQNVMPWCPRCGTSLSEHECEGSYHDVECEAVFCKLPLLEENAKMLVWTTTPWTLTSNVALAVNPELEYSYVKVKSDDMPVILCSSALKVLKDDIVEVIKTVKGSDLVGKTYETMFPELDCQKFVHKIVPWEEVDATEGVGVVHIAPGCGESDFNLGKKLGLPAINPIDDMGIITSEFGEFAGKSTEDVKEDIFAGLRKQNKLYRTHTYAHRYPFCWRCKTDIVFKLVNGWYIKTAPIKPKLIEEVSKVEWKPDFAGKRMIDWLNNMGDWNISRKRFYGLPLPFYVCPKCGKVTVIGSLEELRERAADKSKVDALPHLHRPWIDDVEIVCDCGERVKRITDVGDCWLDAGITPFSTKKYFTDKEYFKKNFPNECVIEMIEQIRLWFYSLLFMSVVLEGRAPYERVMVYESVVQEDGSKFHKSGYMIKFDEAAERMGSDVIRYLYASAPNSSDIRFGYNLGDEAKRKLLGFWNAYVFYNTYASIDNPKLDGFVPDISKMNNLDRWLLQATDDFVAFAKKSYDNYDLPSIMKYFETFIDDLTNWYIRINRRRFWKNSGDDQLNAYYTLYNAIKKTCGIMAPILPFVTEHIWQNLVRETEKNAPISIHLSDFPECENYNLEKLIDETSKVRDIIYLAQKLRNEHQIKVKQPLKTMYLNCTDDYKSAVKDYLGVICDEINVKNIEFVTNSTKFNNHVLTLNFRVAGAKLKGDVNRVKEALANIDSDTMNGLAEKFSKGESISVLGYELDPTMLEMKLVPKDEFAVANIGNNLVVLDIELDENLIEEGNLRELIRSIQVARKDANFELSDRISLEITSSSDVINNLVEKYKDTIMSEVLATKYGVTNPDYTCEITIDNIAVVLKLKK